MKKVTRRVIENIIFQELAICMFFLQVGSFGERMFLLFSHLISWRFFFFCFYIYLLVIFRSDRYFFSRNIKIKNFKVFLWQWIHSGQDRYVLCFVVHFCDSHQTK